MWADRRIEVRLFSFFSLHFFLFFIYFRLLRRLRRNPLRSRSIYALPARAQLTMKSSSCSVHADRPKHYFSVFFFFLFVRVSPCGNFAQPPLRVKCHFFSCQKSPPLHAVIQCKRDNIVVLFRPTKESQKPARVQEFCLVIYNSDIFKDVGFGPRIINYTLCDLTDYKSPKSFVIIIFSLFGIQFRIRYLRVGFNIESGQ